MARGEVIKLVDDFIESDIAVGEVFCDNMKRARSSISTALNRKNLKDIIDVRQINNRVFMINLTKMEES